MAQDDAVQLTVRGFGRAEVTIGTLVLDPEAGMLFPLALVLAQRAGERIPRAWLIELLWPGSEDSAGRHSLRQALYRLRKAGLATEDRADDVRIETQWVTSDITAVLRHDWPYRAEPEEIERAAALLPGFTTQSGTRLDEWREQLRGRVSSQYRLATLHRLTLARREGRWAEADHWSLMCLQDDPLNEEATLARAEAAAMRGAKNAALEILDTFLDELGERERQIGLPARMLKRRISDLTDTSTRRITATSAPFIGRHEQIARVNDLMDLARKGEAQAYWFIGPPGIGKTRLMRELARFARMAGWCAVSGDARPSFEDRPFALMIDLLPQLMEAPGALGVDPDSLRLLRQLGRAEADSEPLEPEEIRGRQHAIYLAWVDLMEAVLGETPLLLLMDDVQWSDAVTLQMLGRFLESHPTARVAMIAATRNAQRPRDAAATRLTQASSERIAPMTDAEMREFARTVGLPLDDAFEATAERLGTASGGNPLFLGHLVHQHQMQGIGERLPADLSTLIDDQLRSLSREAQRALQACALLGQHATLPRIERVLGVSAPALVAPFGELDDILALPSEPGQALAPHDLWADRVRAGMTAGVFRAMAVCAARVLEGDAEQDGNIDMFWSAARLFELSGEKQMAYAVMMRCGDYLAATGSAPDACRAYEAAARVAGSPASLRAALSGQLLGLHSSGDFAAARIVLIGLRDIERDHPHLRLAPEQELLAIEVEHFAGSTSRMHKLLAELSSNLELTADTRLGAIRTGLTTADNCHDEQSRDFFLSAFAAFKEQPADALARLRTAVVALTLQGDFSSSIEMSNALLIESRRRPTYSRLLWDLRISTVARRRLGAEGEAIELLNESQALARKHGYACAQFLACYIRAGIQFDYSLFDTAEASLVEAESLFSDGLGPLLRESLTLAWANLLLANGDLAGAQRHSRTLSDLDLSSHTRHAMLRAALELRLCIGRGEREHAEALLSHLISSHAPVLRFGGADQVATAATCAHAALSGEEAASAFAKHYVESLRFDRSPLPPLLQRYGVSGAGN